MALKTIKEHWDDLIRMATSNGARKLHPIQEREMKKAFYAGAWCVVCNAIAIGQDDVSESDGIDCLQDMENECLAFMKSAIKKHSEGN